jgi:hypothetical protein
MTAWTWERNGGMWLLVGGFALLAIVIIMALNVGGTRSDVERTAANGMMRLGMGAEVPVPVAAEWPERTIPYSETPPSFATPDFPPLPEQEPEVTVINKKPDWRPPFWENQQFK